MVSLFDVKNVFDGGKNVMSIVGKKRSLLKRLKKEALRLKFLWKSSSFKWNTLTLPVSFMEDVVFKVVSAFEAVVLVLTLCFFYLCCGCSF
ncbi:transmembrane protein, putative [Medicago truncatula]|uniref:Transmembrane protein, putative n=2 Tax=Medicago truncatula TaxID=3880 RepID=A0A072UPW7_MEDTR|nr:transmembrane protein, putative [Medicago truncatula]